MEKRQRKIRNVLIYLLTADMVSGYDCNKMGVQILTVSYKGHTAQLAVTVYAKASGDANGDGAVNQEDYICLSEILLKASAYNASLDMNGDGKIDVIDGILLRKK